MSLKRRAFLLATSAAILAPSAVRATGGLDDFSPVPSPSPGASAAQIRVLLGRGMATAIDAQSFSFGSRDYRGTFSTTPDGQIVNTVALESYLYSVVAAEMPRSWPEQALQAQAILARTFALSRSNPNRAYDVVASQRDQAYGGLRGEFAQTTAAVDATAGTVLRFGGHLASIAYMSCCGGHTEAAADAWGGAGAPYLRGVPCDFCAPSPDYHWKQDVPLQALHNAFAAKLESVGALSGVQIESTDSSGRARSIRLSGPGGSVSISGSDFRTGLGPAVVKSLLLRSVALQPDSSQAGGTITIEGSGRGHGVGLCQWGSRELGSQGRSAADILAYYFPGTEQGNG